MPITKIEMPDGESIQVDLPEGDWSKEQIVTALQKKGVVPTGVDALDRFASDFLKSGNITQNLADYAESHLPAGELVWEDGLKYKSSDEIYGEEYMSMSPKERRQVIKTKREQQVHELNKKVRIEEDLMRQRDEINIAGGAGILAKALVDPAAIPLGAVKVGGAVVKGVTGTAKVGQAAKSAAAGGAILGGSYGASEHMADEGLPTNAKEALSFTADTAIAAGMGAVAAGVLGGAVSAFSNRGALARRAVTKYNIADPNRAQKIGDQFEAIVSDHVMAGKPVKEANRLAMKALELTRKDVINLAKGREGGKFNLPSAKDKLYAVNERTAQSAVEYQMALHKYRAQGMDVTSAARAARSELGIGIKDVVRMRRMMPAGKFDVLDPESAAKSLLDYKVVSHGGTTLGNAPQSWFDKVVQPLYDAVYNVNPKIAHLLRKMEGSVFIKSQQAHESVAQFNKFARKLSSADRDQVQLALRKKDFATVERIIKAKFGEDGAAAFSSVRGVLDSIADELAKTDVKFKKMDQFFPSLVKDVKGLKAHLASKKINVEGILQEAADAKGAPLNNVEINKLLHKALSKPNKYQRAQATQHRRVAQDDLDLETMGFYEDFVTALDLYIRDSYSTIARRNFFGKGLKVGKHSVEDMNTSIKNLLAGENITGEQATELTRLLQARFVGGEMHGTRALNNLRSITSGVTLGNPLSAAVQLGDIGPVMWTKGVLNTIRSMPRAFMETARGTAGRASKYGRSADDLGLTREIIQELQTGGWSSTKIRRITDNFYTWGGFKLIDRFGKNVTIETAITRASRMAKRNPNKLIEELAKGGWQADEIGQLMTDLAANKSSGIVKQFAFSELSGLQPISKTEMPTGYLNNPDMRLFYQFKTWGLKQLSLIRNNIIKDVLSKDPVRTAKGVKELAVFSVIVGSTQMGARDVKNFLAGKPSMLEDPSQVPEEAFFSILATIGFNKWGLEQLAGRGEFAKGVGIGIPSAEITAKFGKDLGQGLYRAARGEDWRHNTPLQNAAFKDTGFGRFFAQWFAPDTSLNNQAPFKQSKIK